MMGGAPGESGRRSGELAQEHEDDARAASPSLVRACATAGKLRSTWRQTDMASELCVEGVGRPRWRSARRGWH
jgi:hypothetical protein